MPGSFISLVIVLVGAGALTAGISVVLMARGLLRPPRMNDGKALYWLRRLSPADLGLEFEEISFHVRDPRDGKQIRLAAWWMPASPSAPIAADRCAVLLHNYGDAKVGAIAWAPLLLQLGFHVLAVDLRAHGESDGTLSTGGYFERHDISQVIDGLRAEKPTQTREIVLFGSGLGAAVALSVADLRQQERPDRRKSEDEPRASRDPRDISSVVIESPFADFEVASIEQMDRLALPGGWLAKAALRLAEWTSGADFGVVRPVDLVTRVRCPLLVLSAQSDVFTTAANRHGFHDAVRARPADAAPATIHSLPGSLHVTEGAVQRKDIFDALERFFESSLRRLGTAREAW